VTVGAQNSMELFIRKGPYTYCCSLFVRQYPVRVRVSFRVKVFVSHFNLLHLLVGDSVHCGLTCNFMPRPSGNNGQGHLGLLLPMACSQQCTADL